MLQSRGTLRRQTAKKLLTHHLYFCMRDFGHRIGDDAEIYFYLYDGSTGAIRAVSERFLVRISKDGFSNYVEKLNSNCCVFTDLGMSSIVYVQTFIIDITLTVFCVWYRCGRNQR